MSSNLVHKPDPDLAAITKRLATLERVLALSTQPASASAVDLPPDYGTISLISAYMCNC